MEFPEGSVGAHIFRRIMHILLAFAVVYYLLPYVIFGIPREIWMLVILIGAPSTVEYFRLRSGKLVPGLRGHEKNHLASYFWFLTGTAIVLWLFPQPIAAPLIVSVAIGDPVIGEFRDLRRRYWMSIGIFICSLPFYMYGYSIRMALVAGLITFLAESVYIEINWTFRDSLFRSRSRGVVSPIANKLKVHTLLDDDFLMLVLPALVLLVISSNAPWLFPAARIFPQVAVFP